MVAKQYYFSLHADEILVSNKVRQINKTYVDPLSIIWTHAAECMGIRIKRSVEVNASWDGKGILTIGTDETLDRDDCLAQMILHELCHALCEGPASMKLIDWGLSNFDSSKRVHEHACLRLQAALADQYGLRSFFAATTMFRSYYDLLPNDPLAMIENADEQDAISRARAGWERAQKGPWADALNKALKLTAKIANTLHGLTGEESLWHAQGKIS